VSRHLAAVPDRPGRVVLYVRVSALTGRGGDEFHSPEIQVGAMRRMTAGMREVAVIDDDIDVSGRSFDRDGVARIRALAEARQIDVLAVYNLARFGRNTIEGLQFLNWLADHDVTILSASEHVDTSTPSGRWMLTNLLAMAEMRSDEIGVEWGKTIHYRAQAGKHHGRPPTGYVRGDGGILVEDLPTIGPAVRQFFTGYADGKPLRVLRRRLQAATGLAIAQKTAKNILANTAYRGTVHVGAHGPAGFVETKNAHVALVDERTWRKVQARVAADRRTPPRLVDPKYPLSGIGRCGSCEGRTNHRPHGEVTRIFCAAQMELGKPCKGCGASNVAEVERVMLERIKQHIARLKGDVGALAAQVSKANRAVIDAATVGDEVDAIRRAKARLMARWAREQLDDQAYEGAMASLVADEERLQATLGGLQEVVDAPEPGKLVALGEKLLELWPRMDGGQRNRALRDLVKSVTIMPSQGYRQPMDERVTVQWR
jgi:site-specific DNA recombinase